MGKKHVNCFVRRVGKRKKKLKSFNFLKRIRTTDIRILNFNATRLNYRERYVLSPNVWGVPDLKKKKKKKKVHHLFFNLFMQYALDLFGSAKSGEFFFVSLSRQKVVALALIWTVIIFAVHKTWFISFYTWYLLPPNNTNLISRQRRYME